MHLPTPTREAAIQLVARYSVFSHEPGDEYRVVQIGPGEYQAQWRNQKQRFWAALNPFHARQECGGSLWHLSDEQDLEGRQPVKTTDPSLTTGSGLPKPNTISSRQPENNWG